MKKNLILIIIVIILIVANVIIYNSSNKTISISTSPQIFHSEIGKTDFDTIWCGTFQMCWNELKNYVGRDIEFEEGMPKLVDKLNKSKFTKDMLSEKSYYLKVAESRPNLKAEMYKEVYKKLKIKDLPVLDSINTENKNGIVIYTMLTKQFKFLEKFDELTDRKFMIKLNDYSEEKVKCFGIDDESKSKLYKNVEILYYNINDYIYSDCVAKVKTKEDDELILYATYEEGSFEQIYSKALELSKEYNGEREFKRQDTITIPYIDLDFSISYDELCGKVIKGTEEWIDTAVQNIKFSLNSEGGKIKSETAIITDAMSSSPTYARTLNFCRPFYLFVKEKNKDLYYFALRIRDLDYLEVVK